MSVPLFPASLWAEGHGRTARRADIDTYYSVGIAAYRKIEETRRAAAHDRLVAAADNTRRDSHQAARLALVGLVRLSEMRRVLKPGGRAVVASFTTPGANLFFSIPIAVIRRRAQLPPPPPGWPGPFSLGAPGDMEDAFRRAGFRDIETNIETRIIATSLRLSSAVECVRFERESFRVLQQMLAGVTEEEREAAWSEIAREFNQLESLKGFEAPSELIVGSGVK